MTPEQWERVARVYEAALEREPEVRSVYVAETCGGDALLEREVASLLARGEAPVVIDRPMFEVAVAVLGPDSSLAPGTRLGPYRVEDLVGAGGMGHVYRASDTRLNRTVAVKVLPQRLADDPQFRERFDREAQTVASLAHPSICTLYDVGHERLEDESGALQTVDYLVLEYLEGETLAARLERGALPFEDALACAIQIAEALDTAHRRGIVHRDLKPGNIMLTRGGSTSAPPIAKLLDFGLAKPAAPAVAGVGPSHAPTTPPALTAQGTILGTFQYMAPEQLEGREADARTDIFAFGAVVYEMFTGKKAFEGKSHASLIGAIMHAEPPPISATQSLTPPIADRIVKKCLAKDPEERWQSARDLASELRWVDEQSARSGMTPGEPAAWRARAARRPLVAAAIVGAVLTIAAVTMALWPESQGTTGIDLPIRATVLTPDGIAITGLNPPARLALSPDGRWLAFVGLDKDRIRRIYLRAIDGASARLIEGSDNALSPFWSADSRFIAFFATGKLRKVDISGGRPLTICDLPGVNAGDTRNYQFGGSWSSDGTILFAGGFIESERGLFRVSADGRPVVLKKGNLQAPFFLPDGKRFLYRSTESESGIVVGHIETNETRLVLPGPVSQAMFAAGHLFYVRDRMLLAHRFDTDSLELSGDAQPVASAVLTGSGGPSAFTVSAAGPIAYQPGTDEGGPSRLVWFDRAGRQIGTVGEEAAFTSVTLSSDGTRLIAGMYPPDSITDDLFVFDLVRGGSVRFTSSPGHETTAVWAPDDEEVIFGRGQGIDQTGAPAAMIRRSSDLLTDETVLLSAGADGQAARDAFQPLSWSRDRKLLLYKQPKDYLWILALDGGPAKTYQLPGPRDAGHGQLAPDGRWVAYDSRESGVLEVYAAPLPGQSGRKIKVSVTGGGWPRWSRDGKELVFLSNDSRLMVAAVHAKAGELQIDVPQPLFEIQQKPQPYGWPYDISPDGRILVNVRSGAEPAPAITLLVNWQALLKR